MKASKKQPPRKHRRGKKAPGQTKDFPRLSLARILQELTPSIEAYLEKSADVQKRMTEADMKIADSVSRVSEHLTGAKPDIRLNIHPGPIRKKAKKSNDPHHQRVKEIILNMRKNLKTYEEIARFLETQNIPTFTRRGKWHAQTVHRLYQDYPES